jgi:prephenate dehydratase
MTQTNTISFLGPIGTYSDEAAHRFAQAIGISDPVRFQAHHSFTGVFEAVEGGLGNYGVIALENSLEGPVTAALDDFVTHRGLKIVADAVLDIHHCLLTRPGVDLADVTTIASHPQGLAQCRQFLKAHFPTCEQLAAGSTAESARMAAANPQVAAIASSRAAKIYHLDIRMREVEDMTTDQTSFAFIAPDDDPLTVPGDARKTSLLLMLRENRAGALLMVLEELAYAGLNLTRIQSRPTKKALGEYLFFLDVEGSLDDPHLQTALDCLRLKLREVRVLGCYPRVF